jgi:hypothetical protein
MKYFPVVAILFSLTACMSGSNLIDERPSLLNALNNQPNGYNGMIKETGEKFAIKSTKANANKLCRVVTIEKSGRFIVESFCKAKGGIWR